MLRAGYETVRSTCGLGWTYGLGVLAPTSLEVPVADGLHVAAFVNKGLFGDSALVGCLSGGGQILILGSHIEHPFLLGVG